MRNINYIVIHCAQTPKGKYYDIKDIRKWHTEPKPDGNGWTDVGYHYVILLDGTIQLGRNLDVIGAHIAGYNSTSIGICYIGGGRDVPSDTRTPEQKKSLMYLLNFLKRTFKDAAILGHGDFDGVNKTCPNFDAEFEYRNIKL